MKTNSFAGGLTISIALASMIALGATRARAQDPSVSDPKHYKLEFENEHVRVLHVTVEPNGKVDLHELGGGVVVPLADYQSTLTQNGKSTVVERKLGKAAWVSGGSREIEAGAKGVDALLIEVKSPPVTK